MNWNSETRSHRSWLSISYIVMPSNAYVLHLTLQLCSMEVCDTMGDANLLFSPSRTQWPFEYASFRLAYCIRLEPVLSSVQFNGLMCSCAHVLMRKKYKNDSIEKRYSQSRPIALIAPIIHEKAILDTHRFCLSPSPALYASHGPRHSD